MQIQARPLVVLGRRTENEQNSPEQETPPLNFSFSFFAELWKVMGYFWMKGILTVWLKLKEKRLTFASSRSPCTIRVEVGLTYVGIPTLHNISCRNILQ